MDISEIEVRYFEWLYSKVVPELDRSYQVLLQVLHATKFEFLVGGDDNRAEYGSQLRLTYRKEMHLGNVDWPYESCSVLEMLIALVQEAEFETEIDHHIWFWVLIENLELSEMDDSSNPDPNYMAHILDTFVWRKYDYNGRGGLFPLKHPEQDQRRVEIWYQFCAYVIEHGYI